VGADSAAGTSTEPYRTVSRAVAVAQRGDVVLVRPGRYAEQVSLSNRNHGVTLRGVGETRPVIDGEGSRRFGIHSLDADDVTIQNLEITGQTEAGIYTRGEDDAIEGNLVHHVGKHGILHSTGIRVVWGARARVAGNTVHSIGPGGESMGVWLVETRDAEIRDNVIYLVRKEGIRDWKGLDNLITGNRTFLNWVGITFNTSTGSVATENYVYDNVEGFSAKHTSFATVLSHWGLGEPRWSRFVRNTVWRSSEASVWIAQSDQPADYLEVRGNILSDAGLTYVRDAPAIRGPHVVVDENVQGAPAGGRRPRFAYKAGWDSAPGLDWNAYRSSLGWDANGRLLDPQLIDPANGDLAYSPASAVAGTGAGARGLRAVTAGWTPYRMTPVDSSSRGTWSTKTHLDKTSDSDQSTYWLTETAGNEFVTWDFGRPRTISHIVATLFSHHDKRNPRGYRFEVSDDGRSWRTVLEGENPDSAGSSYKYELPQVTTARYLRYTMLSTWCDSYSPPTGCGDYFVLSDVEAGIVTDPGEQPPANERDGATTTGSGTGSGAGSGSRGATRTTGGALRITSRPVVRRGKLVVGLRCTADALCRGTLSVSISRARGRSRRAPKPAVQRKKVAIRARARRKVSVKLGARARKTLKARATRKVSVVVSDGRSKPAKRTITLRARR
jgi:hypothetical protein